MKKKIFFSLPSLLKHMVNILFVNSRRANSGLTSDVLILKATWEDTDVNPELTQFFFFKTPFTMTPTIICSSMSPPLVLMLPLLLTPSIFVANR